VSAVKTLIIFIYSKPQMKPHVQVLCRAVNIVGVCVAFVIEKRKHAS